MGSPRLDDEVNRPPHAQGALSVLSPADRRPSPVPSGQTPDSLEAQPPWDLIALLALAFIVLGWMALAVAYNPSHGAQPAFERLHTVTLHQFQTLPWSQFLQEMHTHYGPAFYALVGSLHLPSDGVRAVGLVMHLLSTLLLFQVSLNVGTDWRRSSWLAAVFFASPFQFGSALWGNPDVLATLLMMLGLGATVLLGGTHRSVSVGLLPLTVVVHQAGAAVVAASCLTDWRTRRYADMVIKVVVTSVMLYLLYRVWDGLTPPAWQNAARPFNVRAGLIGFTLLVLGLHAGDRINARASVVDVLTRFVALWPVVTALYAWSLPLTGGGFIFSRIDTWESHQWSWLLISPALMTAVLAWSWNSLLSYRMATAQILLCTAVLVHDSSLYLKNIDFYFWPLLLMRLVRWGQSRPSVRDALQRSAMGWTLVSLSLSTLFYKQF